MERDEGDRRMEIKYSKDAVRFLHKLPKKSVARIRTAIQGLTNIPPVGDIKPIKGRGEGRLRLRVSSWRVIYRYGLDGEIEILDVLDIGNRGDIYKKWG